MREQARGVRSRIYPVLHFMGREKTMNEPRWPASVVRAEMSVSLGSVSVKTVWLQRNGNSRSSGGPWEASGSFWSELFQAHINLP